MNLKSSRFDCDIFYDSPTRTYCSYGEGVDCDVLVDWIHHQKQQFGMNAEKILELLIEELS